MRCACAWLQIPFFEEQKNKRKHDPENETQIMHRFNNRFRAALMAETGLILQPECNEVYGRSAWDRHFYQTPLEFNMTSKGSSWSTQADQERGIYQVNGAGAGLAKRQATLQLC